MIFIKNNMSHRDKSSFVSSIWRHEIQNKQTLVACGGKRSQEGNFCIAIICLLL